MWGGVSEFRVAPFLQIGQGFSVSNQTPTCSTCNAPMSFEREFSRSSLRRNFPHGKWCCPHEDVRWHFQATRLELEILATASKTLKAILEQDLRALLAEGLQRSELEVSTGRVFHSEPVMMELQ
jgi:hypothetical protein